MSSQRWPEILLEFTEEPEAEQYRLSLQMAESENGGITISGGDRG